MIALPGPAFVSTFPMLVSARLGIICVVPDDVRELSGTLPLP